MGEHSQLLGTSLADVPHRGEDPAPLARDCLVVDAERSTLVIRRPRSSKNTVSVGIDETRKQNPLNLIDLGSGELGVEIGLVTDGGDAPVVCYRYCGVCQDLQLPHLGAVPGAGGTTGGDDL